MNELEKTRNKAKSLLEKELAELEERRRAEDITVFMALSSAILNNIDFAERLELITRIEAESYSRKVRVARSEELKELQGRERERALPSAMDEYTVKIAEKRAKYQSEHEDNNRADEARNK